MRRRDWFQSVDQILTTEVREAGYILQPKAQQPPYDTYSQDPDVWTKLETLKSVSDFSNQDPWIDLKEDVEKWPEMLRKGKEILWVLLLFVELKSSRFYVILLTNKHQWKQYKLKENTNTTKYIGLKLINHNLALLIKWV